MTASLSDGLPWERAHTRRITIEGGLRPDGLMVLDAELVDVKDVDYPLASGLREKGDPVHRMRVRILVDQRFNVLDAEARSERVPYPGHCERIAPDYAALVGLNLMKGFREGVRARFFGTAGCSHITEMLLSLPTAALQTFATYVRDNAERGEKPFQLDRCHALATDSEAVREFYPAWYRASGEPAGASGDGDV